MWYFWVKGEKECSFCAFKCWKHIKSISHPRKVHISCVESCVLIPTILLTSGLSQKAVKFFQATVSSGVRSEEKKNLFRYYCIVFYLFCLTNIEFKNHRTGLEFGVQDFAHLQLCEFLFLKIHFMLRLVSLSFYINQVGGTITRGSGQQCVLGIYRPSLPLRDRSNNQTPRRHRPDYHSNNNVWCWVNDRESITQCWTRKMVTSRGRALMKCIQLGII